MCQNIGFISLVFSEKQLDDLVTRKLVGRPLFSWTLGTAIFSKLDQIVVLVSNDSFKITLDKEYNWASNVSFINIQTNQFISNEVNISAILDEYNFNYQNVICINPFGVIIESIDINNCIDTLTKNECKDVYSIQGFTNQECTLNNQFTPKHIDNFKIINIFYAFSNDISRNVTGFVPLSDNKIDTINYDNFTIIELKLIEKLKKQKHCAKISHLVLDVDGVFTDGCVYYDAHGELAKKFDMRDGMGLEIVRQFDVEIVVMTSENSALVAKRMEKLQIKHVFLGVKDKFSFLNRFVIDQQICFSNVAYMGDDVNDLANLCRVGWSFSPQNATDVVKNHVDIVLKNDSGNGAIRELTSFIIKYNQRIF